MPKLVRLQPIYNPSDGIWVNPDYVTSITPVDGEPDQCHLHLLGNPESIGVLGAPTHIAAQLLPKEPRPSSTIA